MAVPLAIGASNVATVRAPVRPPTCTAFLPKNEFLVDESNAASRLIERCHALLSERGDVSGAALATEALSVYRLLAAPAIDRFFDRLVAEYSSDPDDVRRLADAYSADPSPAHLMQLQRAIETPRVELFRRLNLGAGGTGALIEMRALCLRGLGNHPAWTVIETELAHLLKSWFNHGFLECRRIDRRTPDAVLEKLIQHEAVHQIRDRRDLLRRLEDDRRCYALFHPALPDDPVIFTELALTGGISAHVQPLIDPDAPVLDTARCTSAIFYSISNCQEGLRGFSFGNSLIRQVVEELRGELPQLKTFATLSPVPGFRPWLAGVAGSGAGDPTDAELAGLLGALGEPDWFSDGARSTELQRRLVPLCAHYLLRVKHGTEPADPVARFHLSNGARLERINWLGDTSAAGMRRSAGMTVNYVYRLADLERNHEAYAREGRTRVARQIESLSREARPVRPSESE